MQRMAWLTFSKHLNPVDISIIKIKSLKPEDKQNRNKNYYYYYYCYY